MSSKGCTRKSCNKCTNAARLGHVDCLRKYILSQSLGDMAQICAINAAEHGHLNCLVLLHQHGVMFENLNIPFAAARKQNVECLRFILTVISADMLQRCRPIIFEQLDYYTSFTQKLLDEKWMRDLVFDQDLSDFPNLSNIVNIKKADIYACKRGCEVLYQNDLLHQDVVVYGLFKYF